MPLQACGWVRLSQEVIRMPCCVFAVKDHWSSANNGSWRDNMIVNMEDNMLWWIYVKLSLEMSDRSAWSKCWARFGEVMNSNPCVSYKREKPLPVIWPCFMNLQHFPSLLLHHQDRFNDACWKLYWLLVLFLLLRSVIWHDFILLTLFVCLADKVHLLISQ